jgi:hypothetical protein
VERGFYTVLSDIHIDIHVFSTRNAIQNQPFIGRPGLTCLWAGQLRIFDEAAPWYYDPLWAYLVPPCDRWVRSTGGTLTGGTKTEVVGEKPFPMPLSPPQITRRLSWEQIPASLNLAACRLRCDTASLCGIYSSGSNSSTDERCNKTDPQLHEAGSFLRSLTGSQLVKTFYLF